MSKTSRLHRPNPNAEVRVKLTPKDFEQYQGLCAVTVQKIQFLQQQAAQQIGAVQQAHQKRVASIIKKHHLDPTINYQFDEAAHELVAQKD